MENSQRMGIELNFKMHPAQAEIYSDKSRFKVVTAGRRFGKSYFAAMMLLIEGLKDENEEGISLKHKEVFYIAPTFDQGKRIMWGLIQDLGKGAIQSTLENQAILTLINGRKIEIKGADRPDTLRGVGLSYAVLDEYAQMKPDVWEKIIRPTLTDVEGSALFIGTPDGKNHFYDLYMAAQNSKEWRAFSFVSSDNPTLKRSEIEAARNTLSAANFKQEYEASFSAGGGTLFKEDMIQYLDEEPEEGTWYIAVDPAGYAEMETTTASKLSKLDETSIACVKVGNYGWYVGDVLHGRWGIRETSIKILRAAQKYNAFCVGIEKGSLKNAMLPYLNDQMMRLKVFPRIVDVTHGNQKKTERIAWALGGRFEHGKIFFREDAEYVNPLISQLLDFPNPLSHDDLVDSLAYIDQIAQTDYEPEVEEFSDEEQYEMSIQMGRNLRTGY